MDTLKFLIIANKEDGSFIANKEDGSFIANKEDGSFKISNYCK